MGLDLLLELVQAPDAARLAEAHEGLDNAARTQPGATWLTTGATDLEGFVALQNEREPILLQQKDSLAGTRTIRRPRGHVLRAWRERGAANVYIRHKKWPCAKRTTLCGHKTQMRCETACIHPVQASSINTYQTAPHLSANFLLLLGSKAWTGSNLHGTSCQLLMCGLAARSSLSDRRREVLGGQQAAKEVGVVGADSADSDVASGPHMLDIEPDRHVGQLRALKLVDRARVPGPDRVGRNRPTLLDILRDGINSQVLSSFREHAEAAGGLMEGLHDRGHAVDEVAGLVQVPGQVHLEACKQRERLRQRRTIRSELTVEQVVCDVGFPICLHRPQRLLATVGEEDLRAA